MDGSGTSVKCHITVDYRETSSYLHNPWFTRNVGFRQWLVIYQCKLSKVHLKECNSAFPHFPVSPSIKQAHSERAVQSFKATMRRMINGPTETRITKFLFHQHLTPHTSTENSLAELLLGQRPCSMLDVVRPGLSRTVRQHQDSQKQKHLWSRLNQEVWYR